MNEASKYVYPECESTGRRWCWRCALTRESVSSAPDDVMKMPGDAALCLVVAVLLTFSASPPSVRTLGAMTTAKITKGKGVSVFIWLNNELFLCCLDDFKGVEVIWSDTSHTHLCQRAK